MTILLAIIVAIASPCRVAAQSLSLPTPAVTRDTFIADSTAQAAGPRLTTTATGVHRQNAPTTASMAPALTNLGKPKTLMIMGGAAIVLGVVIGTDIGTLLEIGGAVSFLVGLYQYIK
ncbi:MAG: hypothetical protein AABZ80_09315 [Gemmatimonadota bacterium]